MKKALSIILLLLLLCAAPILPSADQPWLANAHAAALVIPDRSTELKDMPAAVCTDQFLRGSGGVYTCADAAAADFANITTPDAVLPTLNAADIIINPGDGDPANGQGGNIILKPGNGDSIGGIRLINASNNFFTQLSTASSADRVISFPDLSGVISVFTSGVGAGRLIKSATGVYDLTEAIAGADYQTPIEKGVNNIAVGTGAGSSLTAFGQHNILMGNNAGQNLTSGKWNFFAGQNAGQSNITGEFGVCIGINSCASLVGGGSPVFIGAETGKMTTTGDYDIFIGYDTGAANIDGVANTVIGSSLLFAQHSSYNTIIGHNNAQNLIDGTGHNIIIGQGINTPATDTGYYLNIGNAITGDLSTGNITIAGSVVADNLSGTNTGDHTACVNTSTTPYAVLAVDDSIFMDASGGNKIVNLSAATGSGRIITIKKVDTTSNTVTVSADTGGTPDTIDGDVSFIISYPWTAITVQDAAADKWYIR